MEPSSRHFPAFPVSFPEPIVFTGLFFPLLFLVGQDEWKGDVSSSHFTCHDSYVLSYTHRDFLPSGHPIFLLLLSYVINTCAPLTSRQLKPFPKCGEGPAVAASLGGGCTEPLLAPISSFTAKSWCVLHGASQLAKSSHFPKLPFVICHYCHCV